MGTTKNYYLKNIISFYDYLGYIYIFCYFNCLFKVILTHNKCKLIESNQVEENITKHCIFGNNDCIIKNKIDDRKKTDHDM